jgi:SET domain-containing protein
MLSTFDRVIPAKSPWVKVAKSGIHGQGLWAAVDIPRGTRLIQYGGEKVTKAESTRRDLLRQKRQERGGDGSVYTYELNQRWDLDGNFSWNPARLANHSCAPNARMENDRGELWLIATRRISAGQEITYDYGFDPDVAVDHPCRCGTPVCAGVIVRKTARKKWRKAK